MKKRPRPELRWFPNSCRECRYYRISRNPAEVSDCLLLGRSLSMDSPSSSWSDRARTCDGWKKRPKAWNIFSEGINPFWNDPYYKRETLNRLRGKWEE